MNITVDTWYQAAALYSVRNEARQLHKALAAVKQRADDAIRQMEVGSTPITGVLADVNADIVRHQTALDARMDAARQAGIDTATINAAFESGVAGTTFLPDVIED